MNSYANHKQKNSIAYKILFDIFADIYEECGRLPESADVAPYGKYDGITRIQWSREWEYPWCLIESNVAPGMNVVDLGCGASPLPILLAKWGCTSVGIDNDSYDSNKQDNSQRLWGLHPDLERDVDWKFESITETSLPDKWADRLYCIGVIEHMHRDEVEALRKEALRIMADDGEFLITMDFNPGEQPSKYIEWEGFEVVGECDFSEEGMMESRGTKVYGWKLKKKVVE